jgi:hypothetical protein
MRKRDEDWGREALRQSRVDLSSMINNIEPLISPLNAVYCFTLVRLNEDFGYVLSQCILDTASREYFKISMQKSFLPHSTVS